MNTRAVDQIRGFNRFYTNLIGVVNRHILDSPYSLSEARVLFELAANEPCTARTIMQIVDIDEGYLSRIFRRFIEAGLLRKVRDERDRRAYHLTLTQKGRAQFERINEASGRAIQEMIRKLPEKDLLQLLANMKSIEVILTRIK